MSESLSANKHFWDNAPEKPRFEDVRQKIDDQVLLETSVVSGQSLATLIGGAWFVAFQKAAAEGNISFREAFGLVDAVIRANGIFLQKHDIENLLSTSAKPFARNENLSNAKVRSFPKFESF